MNLNERIENESEGVAKLISKANLDYSSNGAIILLARALSHNGIDVTKKFELNANVFANSCMEYLGMEFQDYQGVFSGAYGIAKLLRRKESNVIQWNPENLVISNNVKYL